MKRRIAIGCMALGLAFSGTVLAQVKELSFGFISTEAASNLKTNWTPVLEDMSRAIGMPVKPFFVPDYAGVIEAMRFNKVQVGWFGNKSAMEAVDRSNGEVFSQVVMLDGTKGYYSLLMVHRDSPLKSVDDVVKQRANLTLGYGDPNSTSGTLVPGFFVFSKNGVDPVKDFKRTVRSGHEANLLAVASKQVDVATNNTENVGRFEKTNPEKLKELREIWRSPLIASDPLVYRKDLDPAIQAKVRDFILNYGKTEAEKKNLAVLGYSAFAASSDKQLLPIRQLELVKDRAKIEANTEMNANDRAAKLRDIDNRLAELGKQVVSSAN